jgi:hypothetical protein
VRSSPDSPFVRQVRLLLEGTPARGFGFMVEADFFSTAGPGSSAMLVKAWLSWNRCKELQFRIGQFKTPISRERHNALLVNEMAEFSLPARFTPGLEIAAEIPGSIGEGALEHASATATGRGHLDNQGRSRNGDNEDKEHLARVTVDPWARSEDSWLRRLRLGAPGSYTEVDDVALAKFQIAF